MSHHPQSANRPLHLAAIIGGLLLSASIGCSKPTASAPPAGGDSSAASVTTSSDRSPDSTAASAPSMASNSAGGMGSGGGTASPAQKNRKWIGNVPYDVWFDDPLAVAANSNQVAAATPRTPAVTGSATAGPGTTDNPADSDSMRSGATNSNADSQEMAGADGGSNASANPDEWSTLLPMEVLQNEIKKIRNRLDGSLKSVGQYNGNFKDIAIDGQVLSALAIIAAGHSEAFSWKPNAGYVRDLASQMADSSSKLGKEAYTKTQTAFEKVVSVMSGSIPPDVGEQPGDKPAADVVSRPAVMARIEKGSNWMSANFSTEAQFKKDTEGIAAEAAVLAGLAQLMGTKGYDFADEDEYQTYLKKLVTGSAEASAGARDGDYARFSSGIDRIKKSCGECHNKYATE